MLKRKEVIHMELEACHQMDQLLFASGDVLM